MEWHDNVTTALTITAMWERALQPPLPFPSKTPLFNPAPPQPPPPQASVRLAPIRNRLGEPNECARILFLKDLCLKKNKKNDNSSVCPSWDALARINLRKSLVLMFFFRGNLNRSNVLRCLVYLSSKKICIVVEWQQQLYWRISTVDKWQTKGRRLHFVCARTAQESLAKDQKEKNYTNNAVFI